MYRTIRSPKNHHLTRPCEDPCWPKGWRSHLHGRAPQQGRSGSVGVCKDSMTVQIGAGGGAEPDRIVLRPRIDCLRDVFVKVETNAGIYRKPLPGCFPLGLQCFLLRDAPPVRPHSSLGINMIHAAPHSLSLSSIMKQTARRGQIEPAARLLVTLLIFICLERQETGSSLQHLNKILFLLGDKLTTSSVGSDAPSWSLNAFS